jgi:hypothetical protein
MFTWRAWIRIFVSPGLLWGLTSCAVVQVSHYREYDAHCQLYVQHEQLRLKTLDSVDRYCLRHPGLGCPLLATTVGVVAAPTYVLSPIAMGLGNTSHWLTKLQQCRPNTPVLDTPGPDAPTPLRPEESLPAPADLRQTPAGSV